MKIQDNNKNPKLIRYGFLKNTVYFIPDELSLTICVDPKKEHSARQNKPIKVLLAQIQDEKEKVIQIFEQNKSDLAGFKSKHDMLPDFRYDVSDITQSEMLSGSIMPIINVMSGSRITLRYGEEMFEFINTDFSSAYEQVCKELSDCQMPDDCNYIFDKYVFTMRKLVY